MTIWIKIKNLLRKTLQRMGSSKTIVGTLACKVLKKLRFYYFQWKTWTTWSVTSPSRQTPSFKRLSIKPRMYFVITCTRARPIRVINIRFMADSGLHLPKKNIKVYKNHSLNKTWAKSSKWWTIQEKISFLAKIKPCCLHTARWSGLKKASPL